MSENTEVGPGGSTSPANRAQKPDNHTSKVSSSGRGADASSARLNKTGQIKPVSGGS